jgi:hypothetical protein
MMMVSGDGALEEEGGKWGDICCVRSEGHLIPASYAGPGELSDVGQASRGPMFRPSATFGVANGGSADSAWPRRSAPQCRLEIPAS